MKKLRVAFFNSGWGEVDFEPLLELLPIEIEFDVIESDWKPEFEYNYTKDGVEFWVIPERWFKDNMPDISDYDFAVVLLEKKDWGGKGSAGHAHHRKGTPIISYYANKRQKKDVGEVELPMVLGRLLHEMCHVVFDDLMKRPDMDLTHYYDFTLKNLMGALKLWDLSKYQTKAEMKQKLVTLVALLQKLLSLLSKPKPRTTIEKWAEAIKEFEGWYVGSRSYRHNNPGNLRWSPYESDNVDNFSVFDSYSDGWQALLYQLRLAIEGRSMVYNANMTLYEFFDKYAPSSDGNYPKKYAEFVADKLNITADFRIGDISI